MTHSEILSALSVLTPTAEYILRGETLDSLEWHDTKIPRPDDAAILAATAGAAPARADEAITLTPSDIDALYGAALRYNLEGSVMQAPSKQIIDAAATAKGITSAVLIQKILDLWQAQQLSMAQAAVGKVA